MEKVGLKAIFETAEFSRGIQIYNSGIAQVNNITINAAKQSKTAHQTMGNAWKNSAGKIVAGVAAIVAAYKTLEASTKFLQESAMLASRVEMLGIALEVVGANAGYSQQQIAEYTKAVEAKGITTQAARQALLMMGAAEINLAHSTDLARIAQDAARIANINSSQAFQDMIYGIETGQVRVLKTMGIMVNFENAYKKVAAQLDRTTEELTEQEKVEARVQAVMEFGARIAGTYEASLGTAGGAALSLARHLEQLQLALGNIMLEGLAEGTEELTEFLKDLRKWVDENQDELEQLGESIGWLTAALLDLADLDQDLGPFMNSFVGFLTVAIDLLAVGTQEVADFIDYVNQLKGILPVLGVSVGPIHEAARVSFAEREAARALREAEKQRNLEERRRLAEQAREEQAREEQLAKEREAREKAAKILSDDLDKMRKLNEDYYRDLARMEADYNKDRAKDEQKYFRAMEKEKEKQARQFEKATAAYEKRQAKTVADFQKQITEAETSGNKERLKAAADFARQERQSRERYQLDRIQNERRYQYEKAKAIAEGDTLALEDLAARYKLEQQEAAENEDLRRRQEKENQAAQIREAGEAAREQLDELKAQLDEQLSEQDEAYREQIADQQTANAERLADMAEAYQEQVAVREEQYAEQKVRRDEDHRRQLEDLGEALANQEELQQYGAENVANILQQYYGEDGVADAIMQGWHDREAERIALTAEMLAAMASTTGEGAATPSGGPWGGWPGVTGMDTGGVVTGPAMVKVGAGVVEAFTPLGRAGGNLSVSWAGGPIPITGLERGSPSDVNQIVHNLAESLTEKVRLYRRS